MPRPPKSNHRFVKRAQEVVRTCSSIDEFRAAQAILIPEMFGATLDQTSSLLGVSRATVCRLQKAFRGKRAIKGAEAKRNWGGRRRSLMTEEEESDFLSSWLEQAKTGGIIVASVIRAALAQRLGRPVKPSVVYRLLARHGWRKVAPDTHHPKSDPKAQEDWKKNSRRRWLPY